MKKKNQIEKFERVSCYVGRSMFQCLVFYTSQVKLSVSLTASEITGRKREHCDLKYKIISDKANQQHNLFKRVPVSRIS